MGTLVRPSEDVVAMLGVFESLDDSEFQCRMRAYAGEMNRAAGDIPWDDTDAREQYLADVKYIQCQIRKREKRNPAYCGA